MLNASIGLEGRREDTDYFHKVRLLVIRHFLLCDPADLGNDLRSSQTSVHLLAPGWTSPSLTGGGAAKAKPDGASARRQVASYLQ